MTAEPPAPKPKGRRPKLNPEVAARIVKHVSEGCPFRDAAILSGIAESTFHDWRNRGEADEAAGKKSRFSEFSEQLRAADAQLIQRSALVVVAAAKDDWRAASWLMERRRPKEYGRQDRNEIVGKDGGPIETSGNINVMMVVAGSNQDQPEFENAPDEPEDPLA